MSLQDTGPRSVSRWRGREHRFVPAALGANASHAVQETVAERGQTPRSGRPGRRGGSAPGEGGPGSSPERPRAVRAACCHPPPARLCGSFYGGRDSSLFTSPQWGSAPSQCLSAGIPALALLRHPRWGQCAPQDSLARCHPHAHVASHQQRPWGCAGRLPEWLGHLSGDFWVTCCCSCSGGWGGPPTLEPREPHHLIFPVPLGSLPCYPQHTFGGG